MSTLTAERRVTLRWFPKDSRKIEHELGVCYIEEGTLQTRAGVVPVFRAMGFVGTARKHSFYESYRREADRDKRVSDFFAALERNAAWKAERKVERSKPHDLTVGDVIYNSWGWEQTNVDFYQVVKASANYIWLQPIVCESVPSEGCAPMSGHIQPVTPIRQILTREVRDYGEYDEVSGHRPATLKTVQVEPIMRKAEGKNVNFKHGSGCLWDGRPKYESWYA
jgi:hypothetical protein